MQGFKPKKSLYDWDDFTCSHVEADNPTWISGRNRDLLLGLGNLGGNRWINIAQNNNAQAMLVVLS